MGLSFYYFVLCAGSDEHQFKAIYLFIDQIRWIRSAMSVEEATSSTYKNALNTQALLSSALCIFICIVISD